MGSVCMCDLTLQAPRCGRTQSSSESQAARHSRAGVRTTQDADSFVLFVGQLTERSGWEGGTRLRPD